MFVRMLAVHPQSTLPRDVVFSPLIDWSLNIPIPEPPCCLPESLLESRLVDCYQNDSYEKAINVLKVDK